MVTVFVASAMPHRYPFKLQKPSTISGAVRDSAETFIMDSGIGDDTDNEDVIELAVKHDADYVIPCDELHDQPATTAAIREFWELYESVAIDAEPLIPLQPPYDDHYQTLTESGLGHDKYALGGIAVDDIGTSEQIRLIEGFRRVAPDAYAHALGVGGGMQFVRQVAGSGLVDSVDCATPEMAGQFGCVLDARLRQQEVRVMSGDGARKRNMALSEFNSWQIQDVWNRECDRGQGLDEW